MDIRTYRVKQAQTLILRVLAFFIFITVVATQVVIQTTYYSYPTDGLEGSTIDGLFTISPIFYEPTQPQNSVQDGDVLTAVDGQALLFESEESISENGLFSELHPRIGDEHTYTITRESETFQIPVTYKAITVGEYLRQFGVGIFVALVFHLTGLFVVMKKTREKIAWLFYALMLLTALNSPAIISSFLIYTSVTQSTISFINFEILSPLTIAVFLHFAFSFPRDIFTRKLKPIFMGLIYVPLILHCAVELFSFVQSRESMIYTTVFNDNAFLLSSIYGVFAIIILFIKYFRLNDPIQKAQYRWVTFGFVISATPALLIYQLGWVFLRDPLIGFEELTVISLIVPIAVAISIVKYKLFEIDRIINKSLVYSLASILLASIYILSSWLFSLLLGLTYHFEINFVPSTISILLVALLLNPVHRSAQVLVDRLFYKHKVDGQKFLHDISAELAVSTNYTDLQKILLGEIPSKLGIVKTWFYLYNPSNGKLTSPDEYKPSHMDQYRVQTLESYLGQQENLSHLSIQVISEDSDNEILSKLSTNEVQLVIPLKYQEQLVGLYLASEKKSQSPYTTDEIEILESISFQMAIALKNSQTFEVIQQEKQTVESIINQISEGVVRIDITGIIVNTNPIFQKLLNIGVDQIHGRSYLDVLKIYDEKGNTTSFDPIHKVLRDQNTYRGMHWISTTDETSLKQPVALYVTALHDSQHKFAGAVLTVYDRNEELKLLSAKDIFIATVTHEFLNPITILKNYTFEFEREPNPERLPQLIQAIDTATEKLNQRVNQVIEISSLLSDNNQFTPLEVDLDKVLTALSKKYLTLAKDKNLQFEINRADHLPTILSDPIKLPRIISIILDNAFEFTEKGIVSVSIEIDNHSLQDGERAIQIQIADTGVGIDSETQHHIFEPFTQQGGALYRDQTKGGLGLGLYHAQLMTQAIKGEIRLESQLGKGTSVYIKLPLLAKY